MNWWNKFWSTIEEALEGDYNQVNLDYTTRTIFMPENTPEAPKTPLNAPPAIVTPPVVPTIVNPDVLVADWTQRPNIYHNVRVLCDLAGLSFADKSVMCGVIYGESEFYNYLPDGKPVSHANLNADGSLSSTDWGLCEVNDFFHIGEGKDFPSVDYVMQNPEAVVKWMIGMYKAGKITMWDAYLSGNYKKYLSTVPS